MRKLHIVGACLAALLVAGCADYARSYSFASASEWQTVSAHAAKAAALEARATGKPVYVQPRDRLMAYSGGMHELLQANLLATGTPVVQFPAGAIVVRYDVEPVAAPARVAYGIGQTEVLLTWQVMEGNAVLGEGVHAVIVPDHELINYVAWSDGLWLNPPAMDLSQLPAKHMAIVGDAGDSAEAAKRAHQRMLRK